MTLTMTHGSDMKDCIDNCDDCHSICLETVTWCLQQGGDHAAPEHIQLLQDCAEICQTSANFMIRGSSFHSLTCGACAEICERCATHCESMDGDQMAACAAACRRCAESCTAMAA